MRIFRNLLLLGIIVLAASCSDNDYINAIPGKSTAIISIDLQKQVGDESNKGQQASDGSNKGQQDNIKQANILKSMLGVTDVDNCGIDLNSKVYFFVSPTGNLGLCAKVSDDGDLEQTLKGLAKKGTCQPLSKYRGHKFTVIKDSWVAGFTDKALLILGPVVADAQGEARSLVAKYLDEDEDFSIKGTPMMDRLDTMQSPMAMVAQSQALPERFIAPFTVGAPKDASPQKIMIAADMSVEDGILTFLGETYSDDAKIDASLKKTAAGYRPIKGQYVASMSATDKAALFMNVKGSDYMPAMQQSKTMGLLLAGVNSMIDVRALMNSVDGDMAIILPSFSDKTASLKWAAQMANADWKKESAEWKTDGKFFFGITPDLQFYSGSSKELAAQSIKAAAKPIGSNIQKEIKGQRLVMVLNIGKDNGESANDPLSVLRSLLQPMFGEVNTIVYKLK